MAPIPDRMLLDVLRRPVTRTDASVTLLSEYAQVAAGRIEELKRQLRQSEKDAGDDARGAATEAYWQGKQEAAGDYGSY